jgi:hypothetical protein
LLDDVAAACVMMTSEEQGLATKKKQILELIFRLKCVDCCERLLLHW